ncbi:hypothetical protein V8C42DRAFT_344933 [Trichoderma barbatum]
MKTISILFLFSLGLLAFAQGVFSLPQEPQPVGFTEPNKGKGKGDDWIPGENAPTNDVIFSMCRDYNMTSTCSSTALKHGWCYNLDVVDPTIRDQLEDVGAEAGRCMLFGQVQVVFIKSDCKGDRTAMFMGTHLWTKSLCPKKKMRWHRMARSVRCCAGSPVTPWCSNIKKPKSCG